MAAMTSTYQVAVGDETTTMVRDHAAGSTGVVFVCAHGAGGHRDDASVGAVTAALRDRGIDTVRFDFLYRAQGRRFPDPMPRLRACHRAVLERVRETLAPRLLIIGGRSMGGRVASMLAADGEPCNGLLLLAYPLHPPGRPGQQRVDHLARIPVPTIAFSGTRDPFCTPALMTRAVAPLGARWHMHWIEGADHDFHVLKRSGRTNDDVLREVGDAAAEWVQTLGA